MTREERQLPMWDARWSPDEQSEAVYREQQNVYDTERELRLILEEARSAFNAHVFAMEKEIAVRMLRHRARTEDQP